MKKICVVFAVFAASILMISCGGGSANKDGENSGSSETPTGNIGELNGECYPNNTCNKGLVCDTEKNLCIEDPENPVNDSDDPSEQTNDDADTSSEQNDDKTDTSDPTDDSDHADPCAADPCKNIENSTGVCTAEGGNYSCGCNENYEWNGSACSAGTKQGQCEPKPANTVWNDNGANGTFEQTWNGSEWVPASYPSTFNKTPGTCTFKCASGSAWNGSSCDSAPTTVSDCTGLPENAIWNTTSTIVQTYDGVSWEPSTVGVYDITPSQDECHFICKPNYDWTGSQCVPATQQVECTGLPKNAEWNTAASITQTWNGSEWKPSANSYYSTSSSTTECRYKCKLNYNWSDGECVAATRTVNCTTLPFGAQWNAVSSITQTWNGETWIPSNTTTYNTTQSSSECRYKCKTNYTWNSTQKECLADTQTSNCTNLPAGAKWNTYSTVIQTWDGSSWQPGTAGVYNETPSQTQCRYICDTHYKWNGSKCVADTQTATCTGLPANAEWNTATSITQTWNGSGWAPSATGTFNEASSSTECRFKCSGKYGWNGSECAEQKRTANCTGLPDNAQWNSVSQIEQTWDGSSWLPTTSGSFSNTASTTECKFKCNLNYTWKSQTCTADSKVSNCEGKPANTVWNTAETISQIWDGSSWQPTTVGVYNTTASTSECRYKCENDYYWYNSECVNPCDEDPCGEDEHSTGTCNATAWNEYSCECERNYAWNGSYCEEVPECSPDQITPCKSSNLIWSARSSNTMYWTQANTYCNSLTEGGFTDWHLPNINELRTLIQNCSYTMPNGSCLVKDPGCLSFSCYTADTCACSQDLTGKYSIFGETDWFWSSSNKDTDHAWFVIFSDGKVYFRDEYNHGKTIYMHVRCVR